MARLAYFSPGSCVRNPPSLCGGSRIRTIPWMSGREQEYPLSGVNRVNSFRRPGREDDPAENRYLKGALRTLLDRRTRLPMMYGP